MSDLEWKFTAGEFDPDEELTDEEKDQLRAEGFPEDQWLAQWRGDLRFIVTKQQVSYEDGSTEHVYLLCTADYSPDVARPSNIPWHPFWPKLGRAVEFTTLAEAQQHAQKLCDEMDSMRVTT